MSARILLIEDNPANLELMTYLLRAFGHVVISASDGTQGIDATRREKPDLILCDIQLPVIDGFEVARRLRSDPLTREIPLIAVTALAMVGDRDRILTAGFDDYVAKPIEAETFVSRVDNFLREQDRRRQAEASKLESSGAPAKILIVDDRATNRSFLTTLLGYRGHRLMEAGDGEEALAVARAERPDLVLADILMPTMDGFELVRRLREDAVLAETPVIFLTAHYLDNEAKLLARSCGVAHVLTKPCDPEVVLETVERVLNPTARVAPAAAPPPGEFDREHLRLMMDQLSQKSNELRRVNDRLTALLDLGLTLGSELDPRRLLRSFCHAAREIIGARYGMVGVVGGEGQQLRYLFTSGMDAEKTVLLGSPDPRSQPIQRVLSEGRTIRLKNPGGDPVAIGLSPTHPPVSSWLGAPIISPAGAYGWLALSDKLGLEEFTAEDERLAAMLTAQVGRIYQTGSLYGDIQRHAANLEREVLERERSERRQAILLAVNQALAQSATLAEAAQRVLRVLCEYLAWDFGSILLVDRATGMLRNLDVWQDPPGQFPEFEAVTRALTLARGEGFPGRVWREAQSAWARDFSQEGNFVRSAAAAREGLRSAYAFPVVLGEGEVLGVIELFSTRVREADSELTEVFETSSGAIGQFIERKQAEETLRQRDQQLRQLYEQIRRAEERLRHVVVSSPAVLYTLKLVENDLQVSWMGDNVSELIGWSVEEIMVPGWWRQHLHPDDRNTLPEKIAGHLFTLGRSSEEYRVLHRDGRYRWIHSEMRLLRDASGAPLEVVGSWLDITERTNLEEQLRHSQKMEAIGRLAGGVAHDFNNLLTIIVGYSSLALDTLRATDPLREMVEEIEKAATRATALTRQLLAFSRKELRSLAVIDLHALLEEMRHMLGRLLGEDIELTILCPATVWKIRADAGQIEQVIMNLAVNARDAMSRGGTLTIEASNIEVDSSFKSEHSQVEVGSYVLLAVSDTGSGIDAQTRTRIFEPFFTTKGPDQGTGLGLATVWGIVKQSGGHIDVYSEVGVGTTFKVYLPRHIASGDVGSEVNEPAKSLQGTETILLVEDEPAVRNLTRLALQSYGYSVLEATNGTEALMLAKQYPATIQLMVSDVVMPNLSGRELAERIAVLRPQMKILFVSGYTGDAVVRHGIIDGTTPFLQKPISPIALARKVREVLDEDTKSER